MVGLGPRKPPSRKGLSIVLNRNDHPILINGTLRVNDGRSGKPVGADQRAGEAVYSASSKAKGDHEPLHR